MKKQSMFPRQYSHILRTVALLQLLALLGSSLLAAFPPTLPSSLAGLQSLIGETQVAQAAGTITGNVFRDFNSNGVDDGVNEIGVAGITVTAYDRSGTVQGTATTDADGNYALSAGGAGPYRIEFTNLPAGYEPSAHGPGNGTSTQFVADGDSTNINFGINQPCDYCQDNPSLLTSRLQNGSPSHASNNDQPSAYRYPYSISGHLPNPTITTATHVQDTGSIWGLAYNRESRTLYHSAVLRRHAGLGPDGIGAIYQQTDVNNPASVSLFYDFGALAGTVPDNVTRFPGAGTAFGQEGPCRTCDNIDPAVFDDVGKVGLGDITMSPDNSTLYASNLADRNIYAINTSGAPTAQVVGAAPWLATDFCGTNPNSTPTGVARPWAVKAYGDSLYAGIMCDASTSTTCTATGACADLKAYVYEWDGASWSSVLASPIVLNYTRNLHNDNGGGNFWHPWVDDYATMKPYVDLGEPGDANDANYPQPILTQIEVDVDGSFILAFGDRTAYQLGYRAPAPDAGSAGDIDNEYASAGDLLRVAHNSGVYSLENNGVAGSLVGTGINGPGGAAFYDLRWLTGSGASGRGDSVVGGLAFLPGAEQIAVVAGDPWQSYSGGVSFYSNLNGNFARAATLYQNTTTSREFAKSAGLGDMVLLCDPAPIEIGNRVWEDLNGNGVQDPGEPGIPGITVSRQGPTNTVTTVTDANGNYYFGDLRPNTTYVLTIDPAQGPLTGLSLTTPDAQAISGSPTSNDPILDTRDSDATLSVGLATIVYTTGGPGQNNHGLDFGFVGPEYDLALIKVLAPGQAATVRVGNVVNYEVIVRNQGDVPSGVFTVTDYIPAGMDYVSAAGLGFACGNTGSIVTCVYTPASGADLAPSTNATITLQLQVMDGTQRPFRNWAEISADSSAPYGGDSDSIADTNTGSDTGPGTGTPPNDPVDNHNDIYVDEPLNDEDDNDYEDIDVEIFDLALRKTLDASTPGPFAPGDAVTFQLEVFNQGDLPAYTIELSDYVPAGLTLNDAAWSLQVGNRAVRTLAGPLAPGTSTTVTISFLIQPTFAGTSIRNWSEISAADDDQDPTNPPPIDVDSTPDSTNFNQPGETDDLTDDNVIDQNGKQGGDEDDHDPHEITVVQSFDYGDLPSTYPVQNAQNGAHHRIEPGVYLGARVDAEPDGQPSIGANGDDLNPGLDDEDGVQFGGPLMPGTTVQITVTASVTGFLNTWFDWDGNGTLDAGEQVFADQPLLPGANVLTINVPATANPEALYSRFRFTTGQNQATLPTGAAPNGEVEDYVLLSLGNTVWFDNGAGGGTPNDGIQNGTEPGVPGVVVELLDATGAVIATTTTDANGHYLFTGLPPATYTVRIPASEFGPGEPLAGYLSSVGHGDADAPLDQNVDENGIDSLNPAATGISSTPVTLTVAGEPDVAVDGNGPNSNLTVDFGFVIMDLALRKTLAAQSHTSLVPGSSTITFTIAITNQGHVAADNIVIVDYVQPGFTYNPSLNPTWTQAATSAPETTIAGPLAPGASTSVQIVLELNAGTAGQTLYNYAEIAEYDNDNNPATPPLPDVDSTPDRNNDEDPVKDDVIDEDGKNNPGVDDEDDHDIAELVVNVFDLALRKTLLPNHPPVTPGDKMTFVITVFNQGTENAYRIQVIDGLPAGTSLNDPQWVDNGNGTASLRTPIPFLAAGASIEVLITLSLDATFTGTSIVNYAEISEADNDEDPTNPPPVDIDSTPDTDLTNDPGGEPGGLTDDVIDNSYGDEDDHDPARVPILQGTTPVTLVSFTSRWEDGRMVIEWVTSLELDTHGFHLYRSETRQLEDAVLITPEVILSQGMNGGSYQVIDTDVDPNKQYVYWLEEVELFGNGKVLERISATGNNLLYLPVVRR